MSEARHSPAALRAAGAIFAYMLPKDQLDNKVCFYLAEIIDRETASQKIPALLGLLREWQATTHDDRPVATLLKSKAREVEAMVKDSPRSDTNSHEVRRARGAM
ncbi:hypothetical protein LCGC14_3127470 [marine sediment metagenome]|uniref:Uncharacterized protein n=1 Tax=marine sediment metagenome TaxID=412755 RepID=A0A0F8W0R1_9ZZZZ